MSVQILATIVLGYIAVALPLAVSAFKLLRSFWISLVAFAVLLALPVHEGIFGYLEFKEFDAEHPGAECQKPLAIEGYLGAGQSRVQETHSPEAACLDRSNSRNTHAKWSKA